jgi:hypothetical protein
MGAIGMNEDLKVSLGWWELDGIFLNRSSQTLVWYGWLCGLNGACSGSSSCMCEHCLQGWVFLCGEEGLVVSVWFIGDGCDLHRGLWDLVSEGHLAFLGVVDGGGLQRF